ncbi:hypothetical protein Bpfe_008267 [Biomphalaria pfeifferi]|uniref:Mutator-like transposase domain-containing protein n=1 Tax=Biomphalaria pfeifferi TaxID=112525 RepID=A0AAD8FG44_BIOPF|nr:hypothetical protein Bpfe_008267 [Biomphalaria pfeifferi]
MLYRTANAIHQAYAETDDDIREAIERGENPLIDISVSYDGTWQKRGFTSLYGQVYGTGQCCNSVAKYNFRYVEMLSDGDSSAFKAVLESKPYADKAVTKLDCINHAH